MKFTLRRSIKVNKTLKKDTNHSQKMRKTSIGETTAGC